MEYSWGSVLVAAVAAYFAYQYYLFTVTKSKVKHIPTIGGDGFITSYITAWKFIFNGHKMIQEGYEKYPGTAFKIPTLATANRWIIVLNGRQMVEDVRKAGGDRFSFHQVAIELLHTDHLFRNPDFSREPYHIDVVRGPLTRGFPGRFDDIKDEIEQSFNELLPQTPDWVGHRIHNTLIPIVCRTSNRLFVGLPLCRNTEYTKIQESLVIHIFAAANFLHILPGFLRSITGRLITQFPSANKKLQKLLRPMVEERIQLDDEKGAKWDGRPNDLISWLLDLVPPNLRTLEDLTMRVTTVNFAAIHTTSITLSNVLFDLAARQEYIPLLRAEVEEVIAEYGWTKEGMGRMCKLDSFMKESSRMAGLSSLSVARQTMKDTTLSNGVVIPKGFRIAVPAVPTHLDPDVYSDAHEFKGFRFAEARDGGGEFDSLRHQMVSLDPTFLLFGSGRPACPGRFFAVNEVKAMLSYLLIKYDFKLPGDSNVPPAPLWIMSDRSPNQTAEIMFRKRESV